MNKDDLAIVNRILRDPGDDVIAKLEQMRVYARHRATVDRQKQRKAGSRPRRSPPPASGSSTPWR